MWTALIMNATSTSTTKLVLQSSFQRTLVVRRVIVPCRLSTGSSAISHQTYPSTASSRHFRNVAPRGRDPSSLSTINHHARWIATTEIAATTSTPTDAATTTHGDEPGSGVVPQLRIYEGQDFAILPAATTNSCSDDDWLVQIQTKLKDGSSIEDAANVFLECFSNFGNKQQDHHRPRTIHPDSGLILVLSTLHKAPQQSEAFIKALQDITDQMHNHQKDDDDGNSNAVREEGFRPSRVHYLMVLQGWHDFDPPSAKRAQALLEYMEDHAGLDFETESCNLVLKTWARKENAEGAQAFLDHIIVEKRITVNQESFRHVLEAWSRSKSPLAANRADAILSLMEKQQIEPCSECLLRVIECWAKSKRKGAETRIELLMAWMKRTIKQENLESECVNNSNNDNSNNDDSTSDPANIQRAMLNVLQAYQKVGNAHRAEEILLDYVEEWQKNEMPPPTREMCLSVLTTWSKSKSTRRGYRAEKLLLLMEKEKESFPRPDVACYTAALHCLASSKKPDSARRAEALLKRSEQKQGITPNLMSFTCVLIAWARSDNPNAPQKAESILREIERRGMSPDRFVLAGLITAWGRSGEEDSIIKVENYFQVMKDSAQDPSLIANNVLKPTVVEYTATIQAYANYVSRNMAKSRMAVGRVETLLDEMLDSRDDRLRPNSVTYAAVLKTIAAARRIPDRGDRAARVLRIMSAEGVEVTPYIVGLVKKCNARESMKLEEQEETS